MQGLVKNIPGIVEKELDARNKKQVLLVQLASNGDCLYATAVARQIKHDFPGCHLTWAIGSMCRSILYGNPYIDEVWEIPMKNREEMDVAWQQFEKAALARKDKQEFDEIYMTQISPGNLQNYDGTIRSSIFRGYSKPITVPVSPVIRLSDTEIQNVRNFSAAHRLPVRDHVILFESSPKSAQSFITPEFALEVTKQLIVKVPNLAVILSSNEPVFSNSENIIDGSGLTFRENAELTKSCSLFIGCSSGISWLATSDWAKPLPMIQLLKVDAPFVASFIHDFERWGLSSDSVLEMSECLPEKVVQCVITALTQGFQTAKKTFHETIPVKFKTHGAISLLLLSRGEFQKVVHFISINIRSHRAHPALIGNLLMSFIKYLLIFIVFRPFRSVFKKKSFIKLYKRLL